MANWWDEAPLAQPAASGNWWDAAPLANPEQAAAATPAAQAQEQGPMSWLNRGIAQGFDALAGTANRGVNAAIRGVSGLAGVEDPYQFSITPTAGLMDVAGIQQAQGTPENMAQRAIMGAGEAAGLMVPFGAAARGVAGLGGTAGAVGQGMQVQGLRGAGAEMMAGAGAAVGGQVAEDAAGGQYGAIARPVGELAGAVLGAAGPGAVGRLGVSALDQTTRALPMTGTIRAAVEREVLPFTDRGAREIARQTLRNRAQDPDAALAQITRDSPLSPAQQTGDPNLMAIERGVMARNPQMQQDFDARSLAAQRSLAEQASEGTAPVGAAQDYIARRTQAVVGRLENRVQQAQGEAQARIDRLSPQRSGISNSTIVREELDKAYQTAKGEERQLWSLVPDDVPVQTSAARAAYQNEVGQAGPVRLEKLPADARQWLGGNGLGEQASMRDMKALYSELRQAARNARSGETPNAYTASSADRIADAVLTDMDALAATNPGVADAYQAARAYTAKMKELFSQGTVGQVRTRSATGSDRMDPGMVLDRTVGTGGNRGAVALDDMRAAVGSAADEPVTDYMRGQLARRGDFTPARGEAFQRQNPEIMGRLPGLKQDIAAASTAATRAGSMGQRYGAMGQAIQNPRQSAGAALTQARPGQEMATAVFSAQNPISAARQVARQASRDESGVAVRGLKGGTVDYLMNRASAGFAENGDRMISGNTLNGLLKDRQTRGALAQIYSQPELGRLDRIASELQKLETSRTVAPAGQIVDQTPNSIIQYLGGVMAARGGARLGAGTSGASLKTSSMATARFNRMLESLTTDRAEALIREAVTDPDLFRDLMMPMNTQARAQQVERRLGDWLQGYAASSMAGDEE